MKKGPRVAPIFPAFVRPPTIWGCDPRMFAMVAMLSAVLVFPAGLMRLNFVNMTLGGLVFAGGLVWLTRQSERDPHALDVWLRSLRYSRVYDRAARWDVRAPRRSSWS